MIVASAPVRDVRSCCDVLGARLEQQVRGRATYSPAVIMHEPSGEYLGAALHSNNSKKRDRMQRDANSLSEEHDARSSQHISTVAVERDAVYGLLIRHSEFEKRQL